MDTRRFVTDLPNQINRQIQQGTQKNEVNTGGVREVLSDGLNPITLTEVGSPFDHQIAPSVPSIRYTKDYSNGAPVIKLLISFDNRDETGNDINDRVLCDIFRDSNNNGTFEDDEVLTTLDLQKTNIFIDKTAPADKVVRYRALIKNTRNNLSQWSLPVIINTEDTIIPYVPDTPIVLTVGSITSDEKNNTVSAVVKIEKHTADQLKHMELYFKQKNQESWSQAIILDEKTSIETIVKVIESVNVNINYYVYTLSGLTRGQIYSVKVRAIMKTGVVSDFSASYDFVAGDFVAPNPPRNVKCISICDTSNLKIQTTWDNALENFEKKDVVKYRIYRWEYDTTLKSYVNPVNPNYDYPEYIAEVLVNQSQDIEKFSYIHSLDAGNENKWYIYGVRAYDSFDNTSAYVYGDLVQAIRETDSTNIWIVWNSSPQEVNNFPIRVIWKYSGSAQQGYAINFFRNSDDKTLAMFRMANDSTKRITHEGNTDCCYFDITIDMFGEEAIKEFLNIPNWQTSDNYGVRIVAFNYGENGNLTDIRAISNYDGTETFLINPRPTAITGFEGVYSNVDHQVKFKWAKNTFASFTGCEIKQITGLEYTNLLAHPGDTAEDRAIRLGVWNNGTLIADSQVLTRDITSYNYKLTEAINPTEATELFFLIKSVGNFFATEKYSNIGVRRIYSDEAANTKTILSAIIPAPQNCSAIAYNTEMKVDWTHQYELGTGYEAISKSKIKEFVVFMSTASSDLSAQVPADKFKVYSGVKSECIFTSYIDPDDPTKRLSIQRGTKYYFKIIPYDTFGYMGVSTPIFESVSLSLPAVLPKPKIIGTGKSRVISIPYGKQSWPASGVISVDVYNNRSFQVEIPEFIKSANVDRIKFYWLEDKSFTYIEGMDLILGLSNAEIYQEMTVKAQRKTFALSTDKTLFQIVAVQSRGDIEQGSLPMANPSNFSIVDTQAPSLDITNVLYTSDNSNAINKNNYINKKVLSGMDIYFNAYEKEVNSQIQKVEYSISEGAWQSASLADNKIHITNAELGNDTDEDGKYRDIEILIRAFDNADNTCDRAVTFRKDTVGPAVSDLPTNLSWSFTRSIKLAWKNPSKTNRNLYDGLKLLVGGTLNSALEFNLDSSPFEYKPTGGSSVSFFLAAKDIADNLTYLNQDGTVQSNQTSPTAITIINYPPKAPTGLSFESIVAGAGARWVDVTQDTQNQDEEVEKYQIQYAISTTEPAVDSGLWTNPNGVLTYSSANSTQIILTSAEMDQFAANTGLYLWIRVRALDYWASTSDWAATAFGRPRVIKKTDMEDNIFNFKLTSSPAMSGDTNKILDANYLDSDYATIVNSTYNDYIKLDLAKPEWISDIKLKFVHSSYVRFVIMLEEVSGATVNQVWLQSLSDSSHDFRIANAIQIASSKPANTRYFEYTTSSTSKADVAIFNYENFSVPKAILAKSVSIYFYKADGSSINVVEFQPLVTSIADIFYGGEINLEYMASIRSKSDPNNYVALDKYGFGVWGGGSQKVKIGYLASNLYGLWATDGVYLGGTSYADAGIKIVSGDTAIYMGYTASGYNMVLSSSGLSVGFVSTGIYNVGITSSTAMFGYNASTTTWETVISAGSISLGAIAGGYYNTLINGSAVQIGRTSSGYYNTKIEAGVVSLGHISSGTSYAVTMDYGNATESNRYFSIKGSELDEFFRIGYFATEDPARPVRSCWTKRLMIANSYSTLPSSYFNSYLYIQRNSNVQGLSIESGTITPGPSGNGSHLVNVNAIQYSYSIAINAFAYERSSIRTESYTGYGLEAISATSYGIYTYSSTNTGIYAKSDASGGNAGYFYAPYGYGVYAVAGSNYGGYFSSSSSYGIYAKGYTCGVYGTASTGEGVYGYSNNSTFAGTRGYNASSGHGVLGQSASGNGVTGVGLGNGYGVYGESSNSYGVYGYSASNPGVRGSSSSSYGGYFTSSSSHGIYATTSSTTVFAAYFVGTFGLGVDGRVRFFNILSSGTAGTPLHIDANGDVFKYTGSSERYKDNITPRPYNKSILDLPVVDFTWKSSGVKGFGSWAEKVHEIYPELVSYDKQGRPDSVKYFEMPILILQVCQQQQKEIDTLKKEIEDLKNILQKFLK